MTRREKIFLILILLINIHQVFTQDEYSYIAKCRLNIRDKPSIHGIKMGEFKKDDIIDVISIPKSKGKWYKAKYKNNEAYVYASFVEEIVVEEDLDEFLLRKPKPIRRIQVVCEYPRITQRPIFPGCQKYRTESLKQQCFKYKISHFLKKKFKQKNIKNLKTGNYNITTTFTINHRGCFVNIKAETKYKTLQKEIIRIIKKNPNLTPGLKSGIAENFNYKIKILVIKKPFLSAFFSSLFRKQNKKYVNVDKVEFI